MIQRRGRLGKTRKTQVQSRTAPPVPNSPTITPLSQITIQRALNNPQSLTQDEVITLQRTIGNQAVAQLFDDSEEDKATAKAGAKSDLQVGAVDDKYEQEANQTAMDVVSQLNAPTAGPPTTSAPSVQRVASGAGSAAASTGPDPMLQGGAVDKGVAQSIRSSSGAGRTLPTQIRTQMESAFGASFSGVRIHTNDKADMLNRSLSATAFTRGKDIYFSKNSFDPKSKAGQGLLAHELTHVVQQGGARQKPMQRKPASPLAGRLPSAGQVARSESVLGQRPQIVQRSEPGRVHRCGNPFKPKGNFDRRGWFTRNVGNMVYGKPDYLGSNRNRGNTFNPWGNDEW